MDAGQRLRSPKNHERSSNRRRLSLRLRTPARPRQPRGRSPGARAKGEARPQDAEGGGLRRGRTRAGAASGAEKDAEDRVPHPALEAGMSARRGGLYVGGFAPEEGIDVLLGALELYPGVRVEIVTASAAAAELRRRMQRCAYLVVPGLSYDTEPHAIVMAFAEAVPVIASRLPVVADLVEPGRNGLLFDPGSASELARRLAWAEAFPEKMRQMGECAQADYRARFVADWNWRRLYGERRRQARLHP